MKNIKSFEEFDWKLGLGKKEKTKSEPTFINKSDNNLPVKIAGNNYDNCIDVITQRLENYETVVLQIMEEYGGDETFDKILQELNLELVGDMAPAEKPWTYATVKYKE